MDERGDYDDGNPNPDEVVQEWLHVPLAFAILSCGLFVLIAAKSVVFQ